MKIGVITDCLKQPLEQALPTARRLGLDGVQIYATTGAFSPEALTEERKAFYKNLLRENSLEVSALCGRLRLRNLSRQCRPVRENKPYR